MAAWVQALAPAADDLSVMDLLATARRRHRQRDLASDRRAGAWARAKARTTQLRFVRVNVWPLTVVVGAIVGSSVAVMPFLPSSFGRGFFLGAGVAGSAGLIAVWTLQTTGTAATMMGDLAEQWTAGELRRLRRRGWRLVNHFSLRPWDIDHVLIGPGGVLAVETKWTTQPWILSPPEDRIRRAAAQAARNADDLRAWTALSAAGATEIKAAVVLWGADTHGVSPVLAVQRVDGVDVIVGPALHAWLRQVPDDVLTPETIEKAWEVLDHHLQGRDNYDNFQPPPPLRALAMQVALTWYRRPPGGDYYGVVGVAAGFPRLGGMRQPRLDRSHGAVAALPHRPLPRPGLAVRHQRGTAHHRRRRDDDRPVLENPALGRVRTGYTGKGL
jgi:hypothetical protein